MGSVRAATLKRLSRELPAGVPVSFSWLSERGVSYELAYKYVKRGWLERLAPGVYARPGQALELTGSLRLLAELNLPLHVGGKTALSWFGFRHNVSPTAELLTLYTHRRKAVTVPLWFSTRFPCRLTRRRLFADESFVVPLLIGMNEPDHPGVCVSEPERAVLEMLSEVPKNQSLEEVEHLMESMVSLRTDALRQALHACVNVKTVRLFLFFAKKLSLPSANALSEEALPTGSKSRYVRKLPHGTLVLKP